MAILKARRELATLDVSLDDNNCTELVATAWRYEILLDPERFISIAIAS